MAISKSFVKGTMSGNMGSMSFRDRGDDMVAAARSYTNSSKGAGASEAQRRHRCKLANLVNFYKAVPQLFERAFESKGRHQSYFNKLVSLNLSMSNIMLTKAEAKAGIIGLDEYTVAEGSLPSLTQSFGGYSFTLRTGVASLSGQTTVKDFSAGLLANEPGFKMGDQITFVLVTIPTMPVPGGESQSSASFRIGEITLSNSDTTKLEDAIGRASNLVSYDGGNMIVSFRDFSGWCVHSRISNGNLLVSNERIELGGSKEEWEVFTEPDHVQAALDSYGYKDDVLLTPNL